MSREWVSGDTLSNSLCLLVWNTKLMFSFNCHCIIFVHFISHGVYLTTCFSIHCYIANLLIAVEDLNLNAVESLQGVPYLAIGKHLCGPATGDNF